jgi:CheY-like chemotaxis protein
VINDILDFSKVEAGKLELEITPFELRSALGDAVGLFRASAAEKGLRLHLALAPDLPGWVAGDHIRLRQVVQNLISNSLKFTHSGEIALSAAVVAQEAASQKETTSEEAAHCVRVEVRDTGIGIPPDKIKKLFSSFSQADASISRRYGGTGLGLAICKRLVHLMGGKIDVQSQPGQGSTFRFTVWLGRATAPAPVLLDMPPSLEVGKLRVLLVEDNKINQIVGLRLLEKLGVAADLAENGEEAVAAAERTSYDLILMDVQMPVMDGIAATHAIRTNLTGNPQPFICGLSAHATTDFQEMCLDGGMDGYLIKPLDTQKLQVVLAQRSAQSAI